MDEAQPEAQENGEQLLGRLLAWCPEWSGFVVEAESGRDHPTFPTLHIPSEHPTIQTPLVVHLGGWLALYWNAGYFVDFLGPEEGNPDQIGQAFEFIQRFLVEDVLCGVRWKDGRVIGGGPAEIGESVRWFQDFDRIELRSWRGTHDRDILP